MPKTEVYSWRVSPDRKSALEEAARSERMSLGALLDRVTGEWLEERARRDASGHEEQARLHAAVKPFIGAVDGGDPNMSSEVSARVRAKLLKRYGR